MISNWICDFVLETISTMFFFLRVFRARPLGPGAPVGVLLAGGADDRTDVEVSGPSRETYLLP